MYNTAKANPKEQKELRKALRNAMTPAEATLWRLLKSRQVGGLKFRRQHGLGPYIMDFYCTSIKLCIELDGEVHYNDSAYIHDEERTRFLKENGITVLRFENKVVWKDINAIAGAITDYYETWQKRT